MRHLPTKSAEIENLCDYYILNLSKEWNLTAIAYIDEFWSYINIYYVYILAFEKKDFWNYCTAPKLIKLNYCPNLDNLPSEVQCTLR